MSEILSKVHDGASTVYKEQLPLSTQGKARIPREYYEGFAKRAMAWLLSAGPNVYDLIHDEMLNSYLKGAVYRFQHLQALRALAFCAADSDKRIDRYTREMRRCNQVICRIQRERARRMIAEVDEKLRE